LVGKDFDTIFFLYLVPPILFESGYSLNQRDFFRNFTAIILFAVVGTVISSIVAGMGLFYLASAGFFIGIDTDSPKEGLLFGTLLSATDTVATIAVLRQMGVEPQLYALIFGESVLNDAVAVVLFQTLSSLSEGESKEFHLSGTVVTETLARFVGVFFGSVALGVAFGLLAALITKRCIQNAHAHAEVTIMICMAYLAFIIADDLGLSGLMAVFFAGVVMSHYAKYNLSAHGQHTTQHVARTLAHLGELLTFMYFGFTILPIIDSDCTSGDGSVYQVEWRFVFWTLVMCIVSRGAAVLPLTALVNCLKMRELQRSNRISGRSMLMMWFCILRGAVAFALSLTVQAPNRRFMIPCIVNVVIFTNLILGQATVPVLRLLKIPIGIEPQEDVDGIPPQGARENGGGGGSLGPLPPASVGIQVGRLHNIWRRVDEVHIKPLFGGRKRGAYRMPRGYDDGPEGRNAPMLQHTEPMYLHTERPTSDVLYALFLLLLLLLLRLRVLLRLLLRLLHLTAL
jgi:sodium/hydrogen exchanger 8